MKGIRTTVLAGALCIAAGFANAQPAPAAPPGPPPPPDFSKVEIKTTDLGGRTWMLEGQGGNITVAAGDDGVIMVDSQFAPLHDKIKAAVARLSPQPIRYVINTHYHGDHTGGDEAFAKDGAITFAHANVRKRMAEGTTNALTGAKTPPAAPAALPMRTYDSAGTGLKVKGRNARLRHAVNAHTDGDTYVVFLDSNVLATGDIVSTGARYPNIDVAVGGDIDGMIAAVDAFIALANEKTKIVPGHGALMTKPQLRDYRDMLADARAAVQAQIAAGKSEDEAVAAKPLAKVQVRAGATDQQSVTLTRLIYRSLKTP